MRTIYDLIAEKIADTIKDSMIEDCIISQLDDIDLEDKVREAVWYQVERRLDDAIDTHLEDIVDEAVGEYFDNN